jgi:hypothetical protein
MIDIHDSLASLRNKAQEVSMLRDASALLRLRNPDDATYLESLNSANEELAQIEASITLFEASHRAEFIAEKAKKDEQIKLHAEVAYAQTVSASNEMIELAPKIEQTLDHLSTLLHQWTDLQKSRNESAGTVVSCCVQNHDQMLNKGILISGMAKGYLSAPFAHHISRSGIREALGSCGTLDLVLSSEPESITEVTVNNAQALKGHLDQLLANLYEPL